MALVHGYIFKLRGNPLASPFPLSSVLQPRGLRISSHIQPLLFQQLCPSYSRLRILRLISSFPTCLYGRDSTMNVAS